MEEYYMIIAQIKVCVLFVVKSAAALTGVTVVHLVLLGGVLCKHKIVLQVRRALPAAVFCALLASTRP